MRIITTDVSVGVVNVIVVFVAIINEIDRLNQELILWLEVKEIQIELFPFSSRIVPQE